jgi:hypothetical protein
VLRGAAEIALLCDGNDIAKLVERHRARLRNSANAAPTSGCFSASSTVASR